MSAEKIILEHKHKMEKTLETLKNEMKSVRTGRASTGLVENLPVIYYGNPTPLKQLATMATPQSDMIVIKPFDPSSIGEIEKAIKSSDLSIAPLVDGKLIRLNVPPLSEERRKQLVNQVKHLAEQSKVSIRNIRRDAIKQLEKEKEEKIITEDMLEKGKKQSDDITKEFTDKIDAAINAKSNEIMSN